MSEQCKISYLSKMESVKINITKRKRCENTTSEQYEEYLTASTSAIIQVKQYLELLLIENKLNSLQFWEVK
jgi:hypothetical protein